jgi:DNA-binding CsgD family transcriptional regulator
MLNMPDRANAIANVFKDLEILPFDSTRWTPMLSAIVDATGARAAHLCLRGGARATFTNIYSEIYTPGDDQDWIDAGGPDPAHNPYMAKAVSLKPGEDFASWELEPLDDFPRRSVIDRILEKGDVPHLCGTKLIQEDGVEYYLGLLRSRRQGPMEAEDRLAFRRIAPAIAICAKNAIRVGQNGSQLLAGAFSALAISAFVCDAFGRVIAMSELAESMVRSGEFMSIRNRRLCAHSPTASGVLDDSILCGVRREPGAPKKGLNIVLTNAAGKKAATAQVISLPRDRCDIGLGATMLVIVDERKRTSLEDASKSLGLTRAEASVAAQLVKGARARDISKSRAVSIETVRTQIKNIYEKAEVSTQAEFIALLAAWERGAVQFSDR